MVYYVVFIMSALYILYNEWSLLSGFYIVWSLYCVVFILSGLYIEWSVY